MNLVKLLISIKIFGGDEININNSSYIFKVYYEFINPKVYTLSNINNKIIVKPYRDILLNTVFHD